MSLSEFLQEWNESMSLKIKDTDIKIPSEFLLRKCLVCLLKELNIETSSFENMDHENKEKLRISRIKLTACVNHFIQISFPGSSFCYMELVQPSYKKTFNCLKYLFNYMKYITFLKENTILLVNDKLNERDQLLTTKNMLKKNMEDVKIKEENFKKNIKDIQSNIPKLKSQLDEIEDKEKRLRQELKATHDEIGKYEMSIIEIRNEISDLGDLLVSDKEATSIIEAKEHIENQLEEQEQIILAARRKLTENSNTIEELKITTAKMDSIHVSFELDPNELKVNRQLHDDLLLQIATINAFYDKNSSELNILVDNLELKTINVVQLRKSLKQIKQKYKKQDTSLKKQLKGKGNVLRTLENQELSAIENRDREIQNTDALFHLTSITLSRLNHNDKKTD